MPVTCDYIMDANHSSDHKIEIICAPFKFKNLSVFPILSRKTSIRLRNTQKTKLHLVLLKMQTFALVALVLLSLALFSAAQPSRTGESQHFDSLIFPYSLIFSQSTISSSLVLEVLDRLLLEDLPTT